MKALVLTHVGLEDVSAKEIQSLISCSDLKTAPGRVFLTCNSEQDLVDLCYLGRTFSKVVLLLSEFEVSGFPSLDFEVPFLQESFNVICERKGEHDFTSQDIAGSLLKSISEKHKVTVDRKYADTTYFVLIDHNLGYFGVDFSGGDLGRRDYRIFLGMDSLKGSFAAGVLFIAGYKPDHFLLDPFSRYGVTSIEAALLATNNSPHKFDKEKFAFAKLPIEYELIDDPKKFTGKIISMDDNFKHVSASKKNAKIAGINKSINFSRTDLKWLDAKFGKHFMDRIITYPTQFRKDNANAAEKTYHQLFYQADFILKKDGKICLVMRHHINIVKQKAEEFKFKLESERKVLQGKEEFSVLLFSK